MIKKNKASNEKRASAPQRTGSGPEPAPSAPPWRWWLALPVLGFAALAFWLLNHHPSTTAPALAAAPAKASYVGSPSCQQCHAKEFSAWEQSHHAAAMAEANEQSVRGDFSGARFTSGTVTSTFSQHDGHYFVATDGADGKLADYPIKYTFGIAPLQQYLIELGGGRIQALTIAWDARPKGDGGQRWFDLYPDRPRTAADPLHWTGLAQNWNFMCADCHSTRLSKNYDEKADRFQTRWSEISVGCEACHGPGSRHIEWARVQVGAQNDTAALADPHKGFAVTFDERRDVAWVMNEQSGIAQRTHPRDSAREITACAQCHSRRAQISENYAPGQPIGDGYRVALLDEGLYWPDGQQRGEVYVYGSFLQSRMYAKGVTCSDCHNPHSGQLRAAGNAVCAQCHASARFDAPEHHHHAPGSKGSSCMACHMPTTTFMLVNPRPDHSLRVPRPQQSIDFGVPNACNQCHRERTPKWAAQAVDRWYGHAPTGFQNFAAAFADHDHSRAAARQGLLELVAEPANPAIVRASALGRLAGDNGPRVLSAAALATHDEAELVRLAAVAVLANAEPAERVRELAPLAADPVRAVRVDAARAIAAEPESAIAPSQRDAVKRSVDEFLATQTYNADRPESQLNLGSFYTERGAYDEAELAYRRALKLAPGAAQAIVGLADIARRRGDEAAGLAMLKAADAASPHIPDIELALGLSYVREKQPDLALAAIRSAATDAPEQPDVLPTTMVSHCTPTASRRLRSRRSPPHTSTFARTGRF